MNPERAQRRRSHSVATLDATLVQLWAETSALERVLQRRGVALSGRARRHKRQPLLLELWKVRRGQLMVGALPLRDACAVAYAGILAAPIALAQLVGISGRDSASVAASLRRVSRIGAGLGRDGANVLIDRLGSYHEVMLSVPNVENPSGAGRCRLVVAMLTDSRLSQVGAAGFGFRLGKQMAQIARKGFETFEVACGTRPVISAHFEPTWSVVQNSTRAWRSWIEQPLLGVERLGSGSTSQLSYAWTSARIAQVERGELFIAEELSEQLCPERVLVGPEGPERIEAFHARNLGVQLSYPIAHRWGSVHSLRRA